MKNIKVALPRGMTRIVFALAAIVLPAVALAGAAQAATLTTASVSLSDPRPSTTSVKYDFLASGLTASNIRCIKLVFSANADGTGGVPTGMDTSVGAVAVNTGQSDILASHVSWTLVKTTNGTLTYTNATGATPQASASNFVVDGITNGSQADDDKFLTVSTFNNVDCATSPVDNVAVGFIFTNGQQVTIAVDGSLTFAVAGVAGSQTVNSATTTAGLTTTSSTIPFGTLTSSVNRIAAQDLTVSTNSGLGYTVSTRYTGPPSVNSFTINDLATHTNASPGAFTAAGTEGFGYTTDDGTLGTGTAGRFTATGGNKWAAFTSTNAEVAYHGAATASQTTRVGFQAGITGATEPGAYTTTVIYTATPVY